MGKETYTKNWLAMSEQPKSEVSDSPGFLGLKLASCNSRTKLSVTQVPRGNVFCQTLLKVCNKEERREKRALRKTLGTTAIREWISE